MSPFTEALAKLAGFVFERCPDHIMTRPWMGRAYYDVAARRLVMVIWPLNYAVALWHLACHVLVPHRHQESAIDRLVKAAIAEDRKRR